MVQPSRTRLAILIASLFVLVLLGVSSYSIVRLWHAPIWNPLKLAQTHAAIESMPSVLGSPKARFFSTGTLSGCGGGFFTMEEAVARRIEKEGLSFFAGAIKSRSYREHARRISYYSYAPWQETPISPDWNQEGTYTMGFQCMRSKHEIFQEVRKAISEPGGYFTFGSGAQILALPKARLILITFSPV